MPSQLSYLPRPPHHQQPHYYGAPEIDFGSHHPKNTRDTAPGEGVCCVFDSLPFPGQDDWKNTENIMLVGFEHGLNIYLIHEKGLDLVGRLEGLRGSVVGAKLLSIRPKLDRQAAQLLLAVIVHGPVLPESNPSQQETAQAEDANFDATQSELQAMHAAAATHYQTTVDVYLLPNGTHVANLFNSPKVDAGGAGYDGYYSPPHPVGDLTIQVNGRFVVVSSGSSGEVFIYESIYHGSDLAPGFRGIGKVWTRISSRRVRSVSVSSNESGLGVSPDGANAAARQPKTALLSVSHRWLAIIPPPASSQTTLHGQVGHDHSAQKIPGLTSHTSPTEPHVTCDLETPEKGSIFNKVARDVAQGALKGAQWVAAEGIQAWTNYWSKASEPHRQQSVAVSPPNHAGWGPSSTQQHFPPTHAQDNLVDRAKNQPTLISILDLEKLSQNHDSKSALALQPIATFSLPLGCSLVSFSPDGLHLLTASAKGDDQHVWNLMRMIHGEAGQLGDPDASLRGPSVRQVAHFSRVTEARIIDVVWTEPRGERLAIITERGTVHVNDIPSSAFQWPPLRRTQRKVNSSGDRGRNENKDDEAVRPRSTDSTFNSALGIFTGKTPPFLNSLRGRSPSSSGGFSGFGTLAITAGVGAKGGKAVAAGINRSVSAAATGTMNTLRHLGENRISLPTPLGAVAPGCARWLSGQSQSRIAVSGKGIIRIYSIREASSPQAGQGRPSIIGSRPTEFRIPKEPMPAQQATGNPNLGARRPDDSTTPPGSFWLLSPPSIPTQKVNPDTYPLSYAEIDTSAAYWPFHTDRRVNLYVYDENPRSSDPYNQHDTRPWVFGEAIPATKLNIGSAGEDEDGSEVEQATPAQIENVINIEDGDEENGQRIVISTRRKRNKKGKGAATGEDDEIFEDDCEVVDFAEERV